MRVSFTSEVDHFHSVAVFMLISSLCVSIQTVGDISHPAGASHYFQGCVLLRAYKGSGWSRYISGTVDRGWSWHMLKLYGWAVLVCEIQTRVVALKDKCVKFTGIDWHEME